MISQYGGCQSISLTSEQKGELMPDQREGIIPREVDREATIPSYLDDYLKSGISNALRKIEQQKELMKDLRLELSETM